MSGRALFVARIAMSEPSRNSTEAAGPILLPGRSTPSVAIAVAIVGGALAAALWSADLFHGPTSRYVPATLSDLAPTLITPVDPENRVAVRAAIEHLSIPSVERKRFAQAAREDHQRFGWIVLVDSIDPDGDVVSIEAGGTVQLVTLSKAWTPVPIPITAGGDVSVTAIRDGISGGVTVSVATRGGPVTLQILKPGERIRVVAP
jgi:hypothetical protein